MEFEVNPEEEKRERKKEGAPPGGQGRWAEVTKQEHTEAGVRGAGADTHEADSALGAPACPVEGSEGRSWAQGRSSKWTLVWPGPCFYGGLLGPVLHA